MSLYIVRYEKILDKDNYDTIECVGNEFLIERLKLDPSVYSIDIVKEIPETEF